jgi:SCP-2 sterol transfer family
VTNGEPALPADVYEDLKKLPPDEMAKRTEDAARAIEASILEASSNHLHAEVDLGFTKMPLAMATAIAAMEGVIHDWDGRARREAPASIPTDQALVLLPWITQMAPMIARKDAAAGALGTYLLEVGDGVGPITVKATQTGVSVEMSRAPDPVVTLRLTADKYVRLITGRLELDGADRPTIGIEGDAGSATALDPYLRVHRQRVITSEAPAADEPFGGRNDLPGRGTTVRQWRKRKSR